MNECMNGCIGEWAYEQVGAKGGSAGDSEILKRVINRRFGGGDCVVVVE